MRGSQSANPPLGRSTGATAAPPRRIGIFDSGVGGLTVLREVYRQLPEESVLYFADTARLPYGIRSAPEIIRFTREILLWMAEQDVKAIVAACNTCSAIALDALRSEVGIPVLGLIHPGARAAVARGRRIGVISTPATAASNAYRRAILEIDSSARVWQASCPEFVPYIEQNRIGEPEFERIARQCIDPLRRNEIDTLIYGCTHYPHIAPLLRRLLPAKTSFVDPARHAIAAAGRELELMGLKHAGSPLPTRFCVSGSASEFARRSHRWLGYTPEVESVTLPSLAVLQPEYSLQLGSLAATAPS